MEDRGGGSKSDLHGKSPRADGHGANQRRSNPSPEPPPPFRSPCLSDAIRHAGVFHGGGAEAVGLHLALDDVEGVAGEPEALARQSAVERHSPLTDVFSPLGLFGEGVDLVVAAGHVGIHHPFKSPEPGAVRGRFTHHRHQLAPIQVPRRAGARLRRDFPDAVDRTRVQPRRAVRLGLQSDPNMLDGSRHGRVGDSRKGSRGVVLRVGERAAWRLQG